MSKSQRMLRAVPELPSIVLQYGYLINISPGARIIEVEESKFRNILYPMLSRVEVDEKWYCERYVDVAVAISLGHFSSAADHYITAGYFEDRLPRYIEVDEDWYLDIYRDVDAAVRAGKFLNGQEHFDFSGYREGRLPAQGWSLISTV